MSFGGYDGSIRIDSKIDTKGFNKGVGSMTSSLRGLARAVGLAFGIGAVVLFGKTAVSAASDLAAAMTGLKSVLDGTGKSFAEGKKFIDDYISDGLIPATNAITAYKNLALRGYDTSQINKTLIALKDSAAFGRQSSLTLGRAVESATEGLKNENSILVDNAGVTKNVSKIWEDYAKQIGTTAANLTKQQKIQAEVNGILEETRFQVGDAAKLTDSYSGLVLSLGQSFYNLKVAVGNVLIPILSAIVPIIQRAVDGLVVIVNQVGQIVSAIFGISLAVDQATDSTDALADSTEDVEKAAKGALAAFDDLDVLQSGDKPSADTPAIEVDTDPLTDALVETENKFERFVKRLKEIFGPIKDALFEVVAAGIRVLNAAIDALRPTAEWLWENFLKPLAAWAYQALLDGLKWLADRLNDLADWAEENPKLFSAIVNVLVAFAAAWVVVTLVLPVVLTLLGLIFGLVALLLSPLALLLAILALLAIWFVYRGGDFEKMAEDVRAAWKVVKEKAVEAYDWIVEKWNDIVKPWLIRTVKRAVVAVFTFVWDQIKSGAKQAWDGIVAIWDGVKDWFNRTVLDPIKEEFENVWKRIQTKISEAWDDAVAIWDGAKGWFKTNVTDPIKAAFDTALDYIKLKWESIFTGIKNFVRDQINAVISILNGMIIGVTAAVNSVIGAFNRIHIDIPSFPGFPGYTAGVSLLPVSLPPLIPFLARGAVIPPNAQFLAMLGDQRSGRNIEAPEKLIRQIVREEAGAQTQQDVAIRFEGSLGQLVRTLNPVIERENRRVGRSLIKGVTR